MAWRALPDDEDELATPTTFAAFFDEALPHIYGYFYHRCDPAVAEDLTQETFLAAVAVLRSGQEIRKPLPWLFGIARNKLIDHYRRQSRSRRHLSWDAWRADGGSEPVVADHLWHEDGWRERALRALAAMPEAQRQALMLRYLDHLPVAEIAAALGRSPHAAESLLARGRISFKRAYLKAGSDDDA
jgi:RNA polymerase sigma-70 factor (ECF subfamily)